MSDVNTPEAEETGKRAIAKREWINADGERVPTGSPDVKGVRYTYLDTGNSVEYRHGVNDTLDRQFAAMGAVTKLGNVVNTITNDDAYDGRDPVPEARLRDSVARSARWRSVARFNPPRAAARRIRHVSGPTPCGRRCGPESTPPPAFERFLNRWAWDTGSCRDISRAFRG